MIRIVALIWCVGLSLILAESPETLINDVTWVDGKTRTAADFAGQGLIVFYFSGQCPNAGGYMRTTAKQIDTIIEETKHPVRLLCITPDISGAELKNWAKDHKYVTALVGYDAKNRFKISLQNILQGRMMTSSGRSEDLRVRSTNIDAVKTFCAGVPVGSWYFSVGELTSAPVKNLWWDCEMDRPQAIRNLVTAESQIKHNKDDKLKAEFAEVVSAVKDRFAKQSTDLIAAPTSMNAYEDLEVLMSRFDGLDLKAVLTRMKDIEKDKTMKGELDARTAWRQINALKTSTRPADQQTAKDALALLAKKYPETKYGKLASAP